MAVAATPPRTRRDWAHRVAELLAQRVPPHEVTWVDPAAAPDLFSGDADTGLGSLLPERAARASHLRPAALPAGLLDLARSVLHHRDPRRWSLLYRVAWRLTTQDADLLHDATDLDVRRLHDWARQVGRDVHKMHAFVRFRKVTTDGGDVYVAWYRPDHLILPLVERFFRERFNSLRWSILTPDGSLHWDGTTCRRGAPATRDQAPDEDALEQLWRTYYGAIFNPARTNLPAMTREMPRRYWDLLPEAQDIAALVAVASERTTTMVRTRSDAPSARPWVPETTDLPALAKAAQACAGCDLYREATQAVFGQGSPSANLVLVGEQPGNEEDQQGAPFVGPAGRVLDEALEEAGIDRRQVYVTNAVKHFKFEPRGTWRIHKKPEATEVRACRPWLEAELHAVKPTVVVCLGATAAQSLLGPQARVGAAAEPVASPWAPSTLVTCHPSAVLRARDDDERAAMRTRLVHDLRLAATLANTTRITR